VRGAPERRGKKSCATMMIEMSNAGVCSLRVLLVQGWFTHDGFNYGGRIGKYYRELIAHLSRHGHVATFEYDDGEAVASVLSRLRSTLVATDFTHVIGHSMGGALIVQLMRERHDFRASAIVLCQALIAPSRLLAAACAYIGRLPWYRRIQVPVPLIEPSWALQANWSFFTDIANVARRAYLHQLVDTTNMMAGDCVDVLRAHPGAVSVVYSSDDTLCPVDAATLLSLTRWADRASRRFVVVKARHMPSWDAEPTRQMLWHALDDILLARPA
jgi:pimeloyl-ACP methyl ester carboxylesterase